LLDPVPARLDAHRASPTPAIEKSLLGGSPATAKSLRQGGFKPSPPTQTAHDRRRLAPPQAPCLRPAPGQGAPRRQLHAEISPIPAWRTTISCARRSNRSSRDANRDRTRSLNNIQIPNS